MKDKLGSWVEREKAREDGFLAEKNQRNVWVTFTEITSHARKSEVSDWAEFQVSNRSPLYSEMLGKGTFKLHVWINNSPWKWLSWKSISHLSRYVPVKGLHQTHSGTLFTETLPHPHWRSSVLCTRINISYKRCYVLFCIKYLVCWRQITFVCLLSTSEDLGL